MRQTCGTEEVRPNRLTEVTKGTEPRTIAFMRTRSSTVVGCNPISV